jgi:hypothetical protein
MVAVLSDILEAYRSDLARTLAILATNFEIFLFSNSFRPVLGITQEPVHSEEKILCFARYEVAWA